MTAKLSISGIAPLALLLVLAAAPLGVGRLTVTPDSMRYFDVASQIAAGKGATSLHLNLASETVPAHLGLWAPGYPAALGILLSAGLDRPSAALFVNLAALLLLVLATARIARRLSLPPAAGVLAAAMVLSHPQIRLVWGFAWSEPVFVGITWLAISLVLDGAADPRPRLAHLLAAGVLAGAATALRYSGLFLVGLTGVALLVLGLRRWGIARTAAALLAFVLPVIAAGAVALAGNVAAFGSPFGPPRPAPDAPLPFLLRRIHQLLAALEGSAAGLPILLLALALLASLRRRAEPPPEEHGSGLRALYVAGFVLAYCGGLLLSLANVVTSPIAARYIVPVAPGLVLVSLWLLRRRIDPDLFRGTRGRLALAVAAGIVLVSAVDATGVRRNTQLEPTPREDAVAAWARPLAAPDALFVGHGLWWLRYREGVPVLEGGDHANPPLEAAAVARWIETTDSPFRTFHLLFQGTTEMGLADVPAFLDAFPPSRWEVAPARTVIPDDTIAVTVTRR